MRHEARRKRVPQWHNSRSQPDATIRACLVGTMNKRRFNHYTQLLLREKIFGNLFVSRKSACHQKLKTTIIWCQFFLYIFFTITFQDLIVMKFLEDVKYRKMWTTEYIVYNYNNKPNWWDVSSETFKVSPYLCETDYNQAREAKI